MREILFRGKDLRHNGKWVYGFYSHDHNRCHEELHLIQPVDDTGHFTVLAYVGPSTVGQYTGLMDKNGKKIFEGDIFKFPDESWSECFTSCGMEYDSAPVENFAVVGFHEDTQAPDFVQYKFGDSQVEADLHENHDVEFYDFISELEVVGNIHDNPELMEISR